MTVDIVICLAFSRWFVDYDEFSRAIYFIGRSRMGFRMGLEWDLGENLFFLLNVILFYIFLP